MQITPSEERTICIARNFPFLPIELSLTFGRKYPKAEAGDMLLPKIKFTF